MSQTAGCGFSLLQSTLRLSLFPGLMSRLGSKTLLPTGFPPVCVWLLDRLTLVYQCSSHAVAAALAASAAHTEITKSP